MTWWGHNHQWCRFEAENLQICDTCIPMQIWGSKRADLWFSHLNSSEFRKCSPMQSLWPVEVKTSMGADLIGEWHIQLLRLKMWSFVTPVSPCRFEAQNVQICYYRIWVQLSSENVVLCSPYGPLRSQPPLLQIWGRKRADFRHLYPHAYLGLKTCRFVTLASEFNRVWKM